MGKNILNELDNKNREESSETNGRSIYCPRFRNWIEIDWN